MTSNSTHRYFLVSNDVVIPLATNDGVVIGRDPALSNFVLADERISRIHAMVFSKDEKFFVKDLNSSNGIYINGKRVQETASLKLGDHVEIRPFKLQFVRPDNDLFLDIAQETGKTAGIQDKLEGSLQTLSIADLIQLLNSTTQSGVLTLRENGRRVAQLTFVDGDIFQASTDDKSGEEAVYAVLRNRHSLFQFVRQDTAKVERQIFKKSPYLLLEGLRQMDEASPPTQVFTRAPPTA